MVYNEESIIEFMPGWLFQQHGLPNPWLQSAYFPIDLLNAVASELIILLSNFSFYFFEL